MTIYIDNLVLDYAGNTNPPASVTRNITSADTIQVTIDTSSYAAGAVWLRYGTPVGCTVTPANDVDGSIATITPTAGATSYSATFRTFESEFSTYWYGKISGTISTGGSDTTPNAFTFTDQTGVALSSTITSNTITVSGIDTASAISISGGTYSINGGAYTSSSGTVTNGQTVSVQHTSSGSYSTATNTTLTIGGVSDVFTSTTAAFVSDTTPDAFTFTDQTGVALSTTITSNTITISGINTATSISITGGTYSINGGAYTSTTGTITNGQTVTVRHTSSASNSTATNTTLTIGGVSDVFTSTTLAAATYTLSFYNTSFGAATNFNEGDSFYVFLNTTAPDGTYYWSTSSGSDLVAPVNGSFSVASNFGSLYLTLLSDSLTEGTETLTIYIRSGSVSGTILASSSITINDTSVGADTIPDAFTFTDQTGVALNSTITSNTITISGINASTSISVSGGTYSISGGAYTASTGTITNGQTVSVRHTSSGTSSTATNTTLTIGGVSDVFTSTTTAAAPDTTPDAFIFSNQSGVPLSSTITSNGITVSGINTAASISISGGTYSIDGGAYTSVTGTVTNGQIVTVRHTSSASNSTNTSTTLTIGGVSDTFISTTVGVSGSGLYGLQIFDEFGNITLDTTDSTIKDFGYFSVSSVTTNGTITSVPMTTSSIALVSNNNGEGDTAVAPAVVTLDPAVNSIIVSGGISGFNISIRIMEF